MIPGYGSPGEVSLVSQDSSSLSADAATRQLRDLAEAHAKELAEILRSANPLCAECAEFTNGTCRDWYETHGVHALIQYAVCPSFATRLPIDLSRAPSDEDIQEALDLVAEFRDRVGFDRSRYWCQLTRACN